MTQFSHFRRTLRNHPLLITLVAGGIIAFCNEPKPSIVTQQSLPSLQTRASLLNLDSTRYNAPEDSLAIRAASKRNDFVTLLGDAIREPTEEATYSLLGLRAFLDGSKLITNVSCLYNAEDNLAQVKFTTVFDDALHGVQHALIDTYSNPPRELERECAYIRLEATTKERTSNHQASLRTT